MNIKEMRQLPDEEIRAEIDKARDKVFRMRFQGKGKDLENPGLLRAMKRDIARMYTVLEERRSARAVSAVATTPAGGGKEGAGGSRAKGEGEA